jgi:hypothetical protein
LIEILTTTSPGGRTIDDMGYELTKMTQEERDRHTMDTAALDSFIASAEGKSPGLRVLHDRIGKYYDAFLGWRKVGKVFTQGRPPAPSGEATA